MKQFLILSFLLSATLAFGQKKEFDKKMIGCYKGSEVNQRAEGLSKYWVSCRMEKGKSILLFVALMPNGEVKQTTENGNWYTSNGKYYELHNYDNVTDSYHYEVLENGDVKFKSIELMGEVTDTYEFTDYLIAED